MCAIFVSLGNEKNEATLGKNQDGGLVRFTGGFGWKDSEGGYSFS